MISRMSPLMWPLLALDRLCQELEAETTVLEAGKTYQL